MALTIACSGASAATQENDHGAAIPFKRDAAAADASLSKISGSLAVVCIVLVAGLGIVKRFAGGWQQGRKAAPRDLERIEVLRLGPKASLHRVRFHGEELLIGEQDQRLSLLARYAERRVDVAQEQTP
jgi:flagellar biogenesis protein FliO